MTSPLSVELRNMHSVVEVCPATGGTLARFMWRGIDILRPAPAAAIAENRVRQMACYPLVPYSNRIAHAVLPMEGREFHLRANAPPEVHALHGFGWQRPWQVVEQTAHAVKLALAHAPDEDWPFACDAMQRIELLEDRLTINLSVQNIDTRDMPAGLGLHPYFPLAPEATLQATWEKMWTMDAGMLPGELIALTSDNDFHLARPVASWKVDNCFTGWSGRAVLGYATHQVLLDAGESCRNLVCFAPNDGRNFIALEPVTHVSNAFVLAARGIADTGMKILKPGQSFGISLSIQVRQNDQT